MPRKRVLSVEFKAEAVRLVRENQGTKSMSSIARDLGVTPSSLCKWVRQAEADEAQGMAPGGRKALEEENRRLRRELEQVTEEREILKKAAAFFAKQSR
jgi:transposase